MYMSKVNCILTVSLLILFSACGGPKTQSMEVRATAYNSVSAQTDSNPNITAWGDTLKPGMKAIAISRDLLDSGLNYNSEVIIEGLTGKYKVLDRMHGRWTKRIDIYMGQDVKKAREWGKKKVKIRYIPVE